MAKSKRQLADERWLALNTPDATGSLPGQVAMFTDEADAVPDRRELAAPDLADIPERCPACGHVMTLARGWAYSMAGDATIQCPSCGRRFSVTPEQRDTYRDLVRAWYAKLPRPPLGKKKKAKRTQGAG